LLLFEVECAAGDAGRYAASFNRKGPDMRQLPLISVCALLTLVFSQAAPVSTNAFAGQGTQENRGEAKSQPELPKKLPKPIGRVLLRVKIQASGEVEVVKVLEVTPKGLPKSVADDLVKKSIEAAEKLKFEPRQEKGTKYAKLEYNFTETEEDKDEQP